ncbi:MAG TPA: hypothetical protein VN692_06090 [Steroidobacteraceae bacterium]|nr:hypothetical protein [Steroidobacteraceae bacterium]
MTYVPLDRRFVAWREEEDLWSARNQSRAGGREEIFVMQPAKE